MRTATNGSVSLALQAVQGARPADSLFLGRWDGSAVFAEVRPGDSGPGADTGDDATDWRHPFDFTTDLPRTEREIMTTALALGYWHLSHPFSARDGQSTSPARGGWVRLDEHGGEHFPRTDPAVIVLVEHADRVLLGSNVLWETGRFSLLAGFVEAGESAEQAVVREVFEEAGVRVTDVQYVSSQPWPFPRSLMLGFRARLVDGADPNDLVPEPEEISELRWFTRDQLRNPAADLLLPGQLSIARWLIDRWVAEGDSQGSPGGAA